jgi:hypothetical protein
MAATFCLRLACGLIVALPILPAAQVPPRFFRVQFLVALGLLAVAAVFLRGLAGWAFWITLAASGVCCIASSIVWHIDKAPGGRLLNALTPPVLVACLILGSLAAHPREDAGWRVADDLTSMAVLGCATTAMLMGHSYLIAPAMSMTPLLRLLIALGAALALRIGLACVALWLWSARADSAAPGTELLVWLPARWGLGLLGPLALGWMAWETARIRSTQSATGILYVVVIVCYLGELTSQLLLEKTGVPL